MDQKWSYLKNKRQRKIFFTGLVIRIFSTQMYCEGQKIIEIFINFCNHDFGAPSKDKTMYDWNFEHDDGTVPLMKLARKYVDSFPEMIRKSAGLLLWGDVGTGKTYMAACIANALIEQEYTVKMTNFATIINDLFASEDKNEYIECLMRCSLLIIDDLGAERSTEYAVENVFNVIDRRYRTGKLW